MARHDESTTVMVSGWEIDSIAEQVSVKSHQTFLSPEILSLQECMG